MGDGRKPLRRHMAFSAGDGEETGGARAQGNCHVLAASHEERGQGVHHKLAVATAGQRPCNFPAEASVETITQMICIIVAHPDDESLWFGGTLLRFREWGIQTVVVSLTNASHQVRADEFTQACR